MNLMSTYMDNLRLGVDSGVNATIQMIAPAPNSNFDNAMRKATKKQVNSPDRARGPENSQNNNSTANNANRNRTASNDQSSRQRVSAKSETANTQPKQETTEVSGEAKLIQNLSEELGIPKEAIEQMLSQLNMSLLDLAQPEKLNEFMKVAMKVDSSAELLGVSDIKETLANIKNSISDYVSVASSKKLPTGEGDLLQENVDMELVAEDINPQKTLEMDSHGGHFNNNSQMANSNSSDHAQVGSSNQNSVTAGEFSTKMSKAESLRNFNPEEIMKQIVEKLRVDVKDGVSELKMILKPENLGEISLKLITVAGVVTAEFIAQNEKIKQILESNFAELRNVLQDQGLVISSLSVSVGDQDSQDQMQRFLHEQKKSNARISSILKEISMEEMLSEEVDQTEILENNVNYTA